MTIVRYRFGDYALDLAKHELQHKDVAVALPARVFECLSCLIGHRERAVSRDELVQTIFGRIDVSDAQLAQVVLRTRRAIGDDGQDQHTIRTVPRFGFRWLAPVVEETDDEVVAMSLPMTTEPVVAPPIVVEAAIRRRRWLWRWLLPAVVGVALAAALGWHFLRADDPGGDTTATAAHATRLPARAILVLPTDVDDRDNQSWARLGLMDFVGDRLRRAGLPVLTSETVLGFLREQPQPDDVQRLRDASKAAWIVRGRATRHGADWQVALSADGADGLAQRGSARHADLLEAARLAADRLAAALGGQLSASANESPGLAERLQRARAAMLGNEIETARRILNEAPELQRAQPRLRYQLARVDFRAGEYTRGLATLDTLLAGDEARADPSFRLQLLNARGAMLVRLDRFRDAEHSYDAAIALAGDGRHPAELGVALSGHAVADSMQQHFDQALSHFGQARVQLGNAGDALAVARVDANLGILEVDRGRPSQAMPYLDKASADFARMGAVNELATLRNMRVVAHLQLLQTDAALAESARAWTLLVRVRDPSQRADLILSRAAALTVHGQLREAGRLLALPDAARALTSEHGRQETLQVELALQAGAPARAVALADAALRRWPAEQNPRLRAWMRLRREQAALGADIAGNADDVPATDDSVAGQLTLATLQQAHGDQIAADASYRAALALAERRGVPADIAAVVVAHATWLLERGRLDEAGALVGRIAPLAERDFDVAVLQARLFRALGQTAQWRSAHAQALTLAGERPLPADLDPDTPGPHARPPAPP